MKSRYYLLLIVLMLVLVFIARGPVIFQEGNPLPIFSGIMRLQFSDEGIVKVSENKLLQKSGDDGLLNSYLGSKGWELRDRLGSGIFYERDGEDLFIHSRMFTRRYIIYEAERPID